MNFKMHVAHKSVVLTLTSFNWLNFFLTSLNYVLQHILKFYRENTIKL